ncbi:hypothetical protein [Ferrimonas aestuarii]|uniref:DUF3352 domain-containing protein n=1 Tax=Ferrimonas aestuarii TaxID=2569539 RepID=A0A4U1BJI8_9GAMM|nr:hypothetical protein [Ferrimonas aestuarii]TKB51691.1 hypothetical protein FCL42_17790 [Ferrimonas aestuarii]
MKKRIFATAVAAVALGSWYLVSTPRSIESHIPDDSVMVMVQSTPVETESLLRLSFSGQSLTEQELAVLMDELASVDSTELKFLSELLLPMFDPMTDWGSLVETTGIAKHSTGAFYFIGASPVFRWSLDSKTNLLSALDRAENRAGMTHRDERIDGIEARVYDLKAKDGPTVELWFAVSDQELVVTLGAPILSTEQLKIALGSTLPAHSLADSQRLTQIKQRYGWQQGNVAYLEHQQLLTGLMTESGNSLAKHLNSWDEWRDNSGELKDPICYEELSGIVSNWPRTVSHYLYQGSELDVKVDTQIVLESKNQAILNALGQLRGFLAPYTRELAGSWMSLGVGINGEALVPSLVTLRDQWLEQPYECQWLGEWQDELKLMPPETLAMFSDATQGFKGVGAAIMGVDLAGLEYDEPATDFDGLVSISASNVPALLQLAANFMPSLANLQIPSDQTPMDLREFVPELAYQPMPIWVQRNDHHLVIYVGEKGEAAANTLLQQPMTTNGLMSLTLDYLALAKAVKQMGLEPELEQELRRSFSGHQKILMQVDVTEQGIEVSGSARR